MKLGYIGLGNQGAPMAKRLVDWPGGLIVFDVRADAMTPFVEAGATAAASVAEVAAADVISVTVLNDEQVREVVAELAANARPGIDGSIFATNGNGGLRSGVTRPEAVTSGTPGAIASCQILVPRGYPREKRPARSGTSSSS